MAAGDYYIKNDILYYDDGSGFQQKGNVAGLKTGAPVDSGLTIFLAGRPVDPETKKPKPDDIDSFDEVEESYNVGAADPSALKYSANNPGSSTGSLRYPSDIGTSVSDYMIFEFFEYKPPFGSKSAGGGLTYEAYNQTAQGLTKAPGLNQIILYMPEDVSVSYKAEWTGKKFGNIAAGILSTAGEAAAGGDFGDALKKISTTAGGGIKRLPKQLGASAVSAIVSGITGESVSQGDIFSSVGGQIINPNTELIFGGHDLRTFTFTYKLVAYNRPEASVIRNIIRSFKFAMLPRFKGSSKLDFSKSFDDAASNEESVPNLSSDVNNQIGFVKNPFLIQPYFMTGNGVSIHLPRFKPCTITDFDVNYTADGVYASHVGGGPVAATITISLLETKLVYAEDILKGF